MSASQPANDASDGSVRRRPKPAWPSPSVLGRKHRHPPRYIPACPAPGRRTAGHRQLQPQHARARASPATASASRTGVFCAERRQGARREHAPRVLAAEAPRNLIRSRHASPNPSSARPRPHDAGVGLHFCFRARVDGVGFGLVRDFHLYSLDDARGALATSRAKSPTTSCVDHFLQFCSSA